MSGTASFQSYPNDSFPEPSDHDKNAVIPSRKNPALFPIDESEEFYDPFSDLSLFLSRRIKKEISASGSTQKWSNKIQNRLFEKILPEFRTLFPKYRLGGAALKKVWEKVSFYYSKIEKEKEALKEDGSLNVDYMIKENLRGHPKQVSTSVPPYNHAHRLAVNISECIATYEGKRPSLDKLARTIWAVQKHLITNLSSRLSKSPFEEYDQIDKLIVKTLLEANAEHQGLSLEELSAHIKSRLLMLCEVSELCDKNELRTLISIELSKILMQEEDFFTDKELMCLTAFITKEFNIQFNQNHLSSDAKALDLVDRILTLYPIATSLPPNIEEWEIRDIITNIYEEQNLDCQDQSLYIFINAKLHQLQNLGESLPLEEIQDQVINAYYEAQFLPKLSSEQFEKLEILIWSLIEVEAPEELHETLKQEIINLLIDTPQQSFRKVVIQTLQFFKKIDKLSLLDENKNELIQAKIKIWALQNDMICRFVHFDINTPLLLLLRTHLNTAKNPQDFIETMTNLYLEECPLLKNERASVKIRVTILYKYIWYHDLIQDSESSYDRFLKWHQQNGTPLKEISNSCLPLTPFSGK